MIHSYLKRKWNNPLPPTVVLPTKKFIKELYNNVCLAYEGVEGGVARDIEELCFSRMIEEIISCLTYRDTAILTLEYECLSMARDLLGVAEEDTQRANLLPKLVAEVGKELFATFIELGAYHHGNLAYQYCDRDGFDIVLMHRDYRPFGLATEDIADRILLSSVAWRY